MTTNNDCRHDDSHSPLRRGVTLEQLRAGWLASSSHRDERRLTSIEPIQKIALVGLSWKNSERLEIDDEIACRAIMQHLIPYVPLTPDCTIDPYYAQEGKIAFKTATSYDLAIFCNFDDLKLQSLSPETLGCRFVAAWGYIPAYDLDQSSTYELFRSPGERLLERHAYSLTKPMSCFDLTDGFSSAAVNHYMPPHIDFAVRNDILETIATNEGKKAAASPLFKDGIERFEKLTLLSEIRYDRGRQAMIRNWEVSGKSLDNLRALAARPLTLVEKAERGLRQLFD